MTSLQLAVVVGSAVAAIATTYGFIRAYRNGKQQRIRRRQVESRVRAQNEKKAEAVVLLEDALKAKLEEFTPTKGLEALLMAQKAVEAVYFEWLNENWHLFNMGACNVHIAGIAKGEFKYELPDELKQYVKRK